jgi:hypothetical protein
MDFIAASILRLGVQRLVDISNKMKDPSERLGAIPVVEARVVDATCLIDQRWKAVAGEIEFALLGRVVRSTQSKMVHFLHSCGQRDVQPGGLNS